MNFWTIKTWLSRILTVAAATLVTAMALAAAPAEEPKPATAEPAVAAAPQRDERSSAGTSRAGTSRSAAA